jgi:CheR methyltransferase, SAM binding domain
MTLLEFLDDRATSFQIQIFGTDLNEKGIEKSPSGVYRESITEEISPGRMQRFFVKVEAGYRVNKPVRKMCVFARQNLANDLPLRFEPAALTLESSTLGTESTVTRAHWITCPCGPWVAGMEPLFGWCLNAISL